MKNSSYIKTTEDPEKSSLDAIKVVSNANRYAILKLLFEVKEDICVHEISERLGISQSATSHQLAYLEARGVVRGVRMGKTKCYIPTDSLLAKRVQAVIKSLK